MRRSHRRAARLAAWTLLILALLPFVAVSGQRQPARADSVRRTPPRTCRTSADCRALRDSLLRESQRRDSVRAAQTSADGTRWSRLDRTDQHAAVALTGLVLGATFRDPGGYRDRDQPFSPENQLHAALGGGLALVTDRPGLVCTGAVAYEIGNMRPSGFPAAGTHRLGKFSALDALLGCASAFGAPKLRSGWQRVTQPGWRRR